MSRAGNLKEMEQNYQCKFCGAKFHRETTLSTHMCVKKRRHMDIDTAASRFGLRTFQKFYELTTNSKKAKTVQEFIDSPYYIDFAKFGNHLATLKPIYPEQFIEFVIKNGVKLKDWTKDFVYDTYIENLVKTEPATSATERTITDILEWCNKNGVKFDKFFSAISENEAAYMIKTGRITPWVLYLSTTGEELMTRFSEDHAKIIRDIIDAGFWMRKFKKAADDVEYITTLLEQAGL
jgi:hypothetical protein